MPHLIVVASMLLAQAEEGTEGGGGSILSFLPLLLIVGGLVYFMMIGPRRKQKAMDQMRDSIDIGDEVRTAGGIYGVVHSLSDDDVTVDVGGGTTIRFHRRAIVERLGDGAE